MMRQVSSGSNDPKKSVFDRLGRQSETDGQQRQMKKRPSPGQYGGDYMPPPQPHPMMDMNNYHNRYGREPPSPHGQPQNPDWRYQNNMNDRRHMPPFSRDRHQPGPPPPPPHMQSMHLQPHPYEMDPREAPYYPHPNHPGYQGGPPPLQSPSGGPMMPNEMVDMRRSSPKYDRHGNMIVGFKDRGAPHMRVGPMDHHNSMSPSRSFMPGPVGPMMHPGPHEMNPNMRHGGYPPPTQLHQRLHDSMEPDFPTMHDVPNMQDSSQFTPMASHRFPQMNMKQQHMMNLQGPPLLNPTQMQPNFGGDNPRYAKWKERREVITSLDRETAQSSSKTDSLKSTLQQVDNKTNTKNEIPTKKSKLSQPNQAEAAKNTTTPDVKDSVAKKYKTSIQTNASTANRTDPQDISDGEIVDDEDSSDDSECGGTMAPASTNKMQTQSYGLNRDSQKYFEKTKTSTNTVAGKRKRMHDRDDYETLDYETISDEDLDDIMGNKKNSENVEKVSKSVSEIELLNALGLDWAHLVELSKKSKTQPSSEGSALVRFSMINYLPTLGITQDLAGPEIFDLVTKVCRL